MPSPQYSAQQEFLRHLTRLARVNAVTVRTLGKNRYLLSALIQGKTQSSLLNYHCRPKADVHD